MRRLLSRATGVVLLAVVLFPIAVLFVSFPAIVGSVPLASCHEEPDSQSPTTPNHACCLIGHNHAMLVQGAAVPPLQLAMAEGISLASNRLTIQARPEPALTASDPPFSTFPLSLRI